MLEEDTSTDEQDGEPTMNNELDDGVEFDDEKPALDCPAES